MSQVQNLLFELHNERALKEQFLRERNALKSKVDEMQKTMADGEEMLRELHSQIGQDIDINPSAKRVYLSKVEYVGNTLLRQALKGDPNESLTRNS